jgi:hypothetical protein
MPEHATLDRLLAVQDLDTAITQLTHRRAALPERTGLTAVDAELQAVRAEEKEAMVRRDELLAAQRELESQIATLGQRREGIEQRMYAARGSSARDLQAMDEEVHHLAQRASALEEEQLVVMVDRDPIDAQLGILSVRRAPLEERATALRGEVSQGLSSIDAELATATTDRAELAATLPEALASQYEALRTRLKGTGAARLVGHRCDGCHLELSSVEVERIRALGEGDVATCEQCGRILVPG